MFRQMLSPANLVELQLEAAGEETRTTSRDDELLFPGDPLSTIKNKASQMPPITAAWCTFNLAGSLPQQKNATLSILTEALKLSSAHLDEMADSENSAEHNSE